MWKCPKCSKRIDDAFEICWACGTSMDGVENPDFLDETVSEKQFFSINSVKNWITIARCAKSAQAHAMRVQLESEGIPVTLLHEMSTTTMFGMQASAAVEVRVPVDRVDESREMLGIVDEEEMRPEDSEGDDDHGEEDDETPAEEGIVDLNGSPPVNNDDRIMEQPEGER